ncbi:DNA polymerase I [Myxococcota bacterium]|nr:DNA polymerase I [Myxococcota bacterium]
MSESLYLVDGMNIAFRAFFAVRGLTNSRGEPTNALFGFCQMLFKVIKDEKPGYLAVAWDAPGGSAARLGLFGDYKGHRPDCPPDLAAQLPLFEPLVRALGIPFLEAPGYEADDVIGTLAARYGQDRDVVVVTGDKDMMQLVTDRVTLLDTMKELRIGVAEVKERFGCEPTHVPDALGLIGDTSDNIPGVPGIGDKGARALMEQFGSLDALYARLAEVSRPKLRENLATHRDRAFLSRELATIDAHAPVDVDLDALRLHFPPRDPRPVREMLQRLEFHRFLDQLGGEMDGVDRSAYRLVTTPEDLAALVDALRAAPAFAFDTETTSLQPVEARLVGMSFCCDDDVAWYVPVGHTYEGCPPQLPLDEVLSALRPLLQDPGKPKLGQNAKYDIQVLENVGVRARGLASDTMLADYLLNPDRRSHRLDDLSLTWLGHRMIGYAEAVGDEKRFTFDSVPLDRARDYAAEDAHVVWLLEERMRPRLVEMDLVRLYEDVEVPLVPVLASMERRGVHLDPEVLHRLSVDLGRWIEESQARIRAISPREFNMNSPKQLAEVLFQDLKLPVVKKTQTGPSTDATVLETLAHLHALPAEIVRYRTLTRLKSTYVDVLPGMVSPVDGRLHTSYNQTVAATGRLSSTDPNLQNIPIRTEEGRRIRQAFRAPPGRVLVSADYSQIELRLLAHLCGGKGGFAEAFARGEDIHRATAATVFGVAPPLVTSDMRRIAKAINFGIIYGQTDFGLSQALGIPKREAAAYIAQYNARYPEIEEYKRRTLEEARRRGYVQTLFGRRRPIRDLDAANRAVRSQAERTAINTPLQGTAADVIKIAMIRIHRRLEEELPGQWMTMQVHDELVFEVDEDRADDLVALAVPEMEGALSLEVPLKVDVGRGPDWDSAH